MDMKRILNILTEDEINRSLTRAEIEQLADDAVNMAISHIQKSIGVETGDFASRFFSGPRYDMMLKILSLYIKQELRNPQD
jgi:hypothetical protein